MGMYCPTQRQDDTICAPPGFECLTFPFRFGPLLCWSYHISYVISIIYHINHISYIISIIYHISYLIYQYLSYITYHISYIHTIYIYIYVMFIILLIVVLHSHIISYLQNHSMKLLPPQDPTVIVFGLANFVVFAADTELQYNPEAALGVKRTFSNVFFTGKCGEDMVKMEVLMGKP